MSVKWISRRESILSLRLQQAICRSAWGWPGRFAQNLNCRMIFVRLRASQLVPDIAALVGTLFHRLHFGCATGAFLLLNPDTVRRLSGRVVSNSFSPRALGRFISPIALCLGARDLRTWSRKLPSAANGPWPLCRHIYFTNHTLTGQKRPLALDVNAAKPPRLSIAELWPAFFHQPHFVWEGRALLLSTGKPSVAGWEEAWKSVVGFISPIAFWLGIWRCGRFFRAW